MDKTNETDNYWRETIREWCGPNFVKTVAGKKASMSERINQWARDNASALVETK